MEKIYHANTNQKAGVIVLLDKKDCIARIIFRNKEGQYIIIKESIHHEDITISNVYVPNEIA